MSPHEPSNPVVSRLVAARRLPLARLRSDPPVHVQARRPDGPHRRASHGTATGQPGARLERSCSPPGGQQLQLGGTPVTAARTLVGAAPAHT